jgi:hypothetical protein
MSKGNENMVLALIWQATAGMEVQFRPFGRTALPSSSRRILKMVALQCQCPATQHHITMPMPCNTAHYNALQHSTTPEKAPVHNNTAVRTYNLAYR